MRTNKMICNKFALSTAASMIQDGKRAGYWKPAKAKAEHWQKYIQLARIYSYCCDNIHPLLFDVDHQLSKYRHAAYNYKAHTNKELNQLLTRACIYAQNELCEIAAMIARGELEAY